MKFTKHNHSRYADALHQEAAGLTLLATQLKQLNSPIKIPRIYAVDDATLTLGYIEQQSASEQQWQTLGRALAKLHNHPQNHYGHQQSNYIGLNQQPNQITQDWGTFFYQYRLAYQIGLIKDQQLQHRFNDILTTHRNQLITFLNQHCPHPSLLHGDLWSGNVLFNATDVWLIDPAVYCGDAEADLAMTELFGGFSDSFYQAYTAHKPLSEQYAIKKTAYNLYHQLNHYNLFGSGYLVSCERALNTIARFFCS